MSLALWSVIINLLIEQKRSSYVHGRHGVMKINRAETCSRLPEKHWCFSRILIVVADEPTCCFLFQSTTPAWPARRRTSGRNRCIGTCAKIRNAGRSSSLPATASSFGKSSIRCCTIPRTEWTEFVIPIDRSRRLIGTNCLYCYIWNIFYKNKSFIVARLCRCCILFFVRKHMKTWISRPLLKRHFYYCSFSRRFC